MQGKWLALGMAQTNTRFKKADFTFTNFLLQLPQSYQNQKMSYNKTCALQYYFMIDSVQYQ